MKLLAIDTSLQACSVALLIDDVMHTKAEIAGRQHAQLILPMIEELLANTNVQLNDLDVIAFAGGPASFTGIRIAASTTQGLAFAANLPVIRVSTLQTVAQGVYAKHGCPNVIVALDAFMGELYFGLYQLAGDYLMQALQQDALVKPNQIKWPEGNWVGVGDAWEKYPDLARPEPIFHDQPNARFVAEIAKKKFSRGDVITADEAIPVYLRGKDAWRKQHKI